MTLMDSIPDPTSITNWPAALVTVVLILAVLVVPSVLTYLGNQQTKLALAAAKDSRDAAQAGHEAAQAGQQAAQAVEATLTTNNGGSHVKDQLDRIERSNKQMREDQALMAQNIGQVQGEVADIRTEVASMKTAAERHHPEDQPPS